METTMTEQRATPTPLIGLRLLRGDTADTGLSAADTDTAPDTKATPAVPGAGGGTVPVPVPVPGAEMVPLSPAERASLAARHWASTAADGAGQLWLNPGRLGHALYHGKPGSMAEHRAYIKSGEWVPPELDGKAAKVITGAGVVYHLLIARPLKIAALTVSAAADRPLRLVGLIALILILVFAVLPHIPLI